MPTISFDVPAGKIDEIIETMQECYKIPDIIDPAWVDPGPGPEGEPAEPDMIPEFTPAQWAKECLRRWVIRKCAKHKQQQDRKAISYIEDNELLT